MKIHRIILAVLMSAVAWRITDMFIVEISFFKFILVELLIALCESFYTFVRNKAEEEPTTSEHIKELHHQSTVDE